MQELKIIVPESLNDIPLSTFMAYSQLPDDLEPRERELAALRLFCGLTTAQISRARTTDLQMLLKRLAVLLGENPKFTMRFKHRDIEWGFVPNLNDLTMGEFVDIDNVKDFKTKLPKLMSILYRPVTSEIGKQYEIVPYDARINRTAFMNSMPTGIALGALVFFWSIGRDCLTVIRKSMTEAAALNQHSKESVKSGAGLDRFTNSAKVILLESMRLQKRITPAALYGLPMNKTWQLQIEPHKYISKL